VAFNRANVTAVAIAAVITTLPDRQTQNREDRRDGRDQTLYVLGVLRGFGLVPTL